MKNLRFENKGVNVYVYSNEERIAQFNKQKGNYRLKVNGEYMPTECTTFEDCKNLYTRLAEKQAESQEKKFVKVVSSEKFNYKRGTRKRVNKNKRNRVKPDWTNQKNEMGKTKPINKGLRKEKDGFMYAGGIKRD